MKQIYCLKNNLIKFIFCFTFFVCLSNVSWSETFRITAIGDVMAHLDLQKFVLDNNLGYEYFFSEFSQYFLSDDLTFANIEVPMCDERDISGYPRFNAHSELATAAKNAGVDVVSLANNHAWDQDGVGVVGTISAVNNARLIYGGIGDSPENALSPAVFISKGVIFGFLSATYSVNSLKMPKQNNSPYVNIIDMNGESRSSSATEFLSIVKEVKSKVDVLVVAFHYGEEYSEGPTDSDRLYIIDLAENGADLIIGHHPHVLHLCEDHLNGDGRQTFIMYSLGNFISAQARYFRRKNLTFKNLADCTEVRTAEGMLVKFVLDYHDGKCSFYDKSIVPFFNVEFPVGKSVGYKLVTMEHLCEPSFSDENITSLKNFDILKQIVEYRLSTIEERIGLPIFVQ